MQLAQHAVRLLRTPNEVATHVALDSERGDCYVLLRTSAPLERLPLARADILAHGGAHVFVFMGSAGARAEAGASANASVAMVVQQFESAPPPALHARPLLAPAQLPPVMPPVTTRPKFNTIREQCSSDEQVSLAYAVGAHLDALAAMLRTANAAARPVELGIIAAPSGAVIVKATLVLSGASGEYVVGPDIYERLGGIAPRYIEDVEVLLVAGASQHTVQVSVRLSAVEPGPPIWVPHTPAPLGDTIAARKRVRDMDSDDSNSDGHARKRRNNHNAYGE